MIMLNAVDSAVPTNVCIRRAALLVAEQNPDTAFG